MSSTVLVGFRAADAPELFEFFPSALLGDFEVDDVPSVSAGAIGKEGAVFEFGILSPKFYREDLAARHSLGDRSRSG